MFAADVESGANGASVVPTGDERFGVRVFVNVDVFVSDPQSVHLPQGALRVTAPIRSVKRDIVHFEYSISRN